MRLRVNRILTARKERERDGSSVAKNIRMKMTKPSMPRKRSCFIRNKFATANRKSTINVFSHWIAFALNWKGLISVLSYAYILMPIIVSMCASLNASHGISTFTSITRQSTSILSAVIEFRFACYQKTLQHLFFVLPFFPIRFFLVCRVSVSTAPYQVEPSTCWLCLFSLLLTSFEPSQVLNWLTACAFEIIKFR